MRMGQARPPWSRSKLDGIDWQDAADGFDFQDRLAGDDDIRIDSVVDFAPL
jgi:hypothetical protein